MMGELACCWHIKQAIKQQLVAFQTLTHYTPTLNPEILIDCLEKILARTEIKVDHELNTPNGTIKTEQAPSTDDDYSHQLTNQVDFEPINNVEKVRKPRIINKRSQPIKLANNSLAPKRKGQPPKNGFKTIYKGRGRPKVKARRTESLPRFKLPTADNSSSNILTLAKMEAADEFLQECRRNGGKIQFKCLICNKSNLPFRYNGRIHVARVHLKSRLPCPGCGGMFYNSVLLKNHERKCSGVIPEKNYEKKPFHPMKHYSRFRCVKVTNSFNNFNLERTLKVMVRLDRLDMSKLKTESYDSPQLDLNPESLCGFEVPENSHTQVEPTVKESVESDPECDQVDLKIEEGQSAIVESSICNGWEI